MIAMLIADSPEAERKELLRELRWQAARLTEDDWRWIECDSSQELLTWPDRDDKIDLMCLDLTMNSTEQVLAAAEKLRGAHPVAHMILIANSRISPVKYMRPAISAQSLLLKPLDGGSVREVFATIVYLRSLRATSIQLRTVPIRRPIAIHISPEPAR